jgi:two-component system, cell cycle response regulator
MAKAKILLVEDSRTQADTTRTFLEKNGYEVVWAENGVKAIKMSKTQGVDLVLLDRVLPDMDGNEVCRWMKLDHDVRNVPIIMLTVKDSTADKVTGLEAGADDYLPKPYNDVELNARIYAALRTKNLQDELLLKNRQLEEMLTRVETLAITDPLTGLFNRRRFEHILELEFKRTSRYNTLMSCLLLDIDHFKSVNDTFGHHTGDMILKDVAVLLQRSIREVDTAARWGGEEFVVILPAIGIENALTPAQRILTSVSEHKFHGVGDRSITVSIGVASVPHEEVQHGPQLVQLADIAMYQAKRLGRNRIETAPKSPA